MVTEEDEAAADELIVVGITEDEIGDSVAIVGTEVLAIKVCVAKVLTDVLGTEDRNSEGTAVGKEKDCVLIPQSLAPSVIKLACIV